MRISAASVAALVATLALGGCSSNKGGETTCGDYLGLSSSDRTDVVKKFLSDQGSDDGAIKTGLTKASVLAYCKTVGGASDPISNVNG
jgi:acid stress chaperone HdeA